MDTNLGANLAVKHAAASDGLSDAAVEAAFEAVRPIAEDAREAAGQLLGLSDPFEAEVHGARVVSEVLCVPGGEDRICFALLAAIIGRADDAAASALLHAVQTVLSGPVREYAAAEIERLEAAQVPCPPWEEALAEPVRPLTAWACSPVMESGGAPSAVLVFEFARGEAAHAFIVHRDYLGDGSIAKLNGIPEIAWRSFRKFLLSGDALKMPYSIEEVDFEAAIDRFDEPRLAMWSRLRQDPADFRDDRDRASVPGMTLLLEQHMTG
ncbi:hypothetical protein GCM10027447_29670 [Glycomyces halotolerans]